MSQFLDSLRNYFESTAEDQETRAAAVAWRMQCFDDGIAKAGLIERDWLPLQGKRVLDCAGAWGGHGLAFAKAGCRVFASDLNDHCFARLGRFAKAQGLLLTPVQASCLALPFAHASFDIVLGLELVEHIPEVAPFAREVARVLRPGGICMLSTPPRLRSLVEGEPHFSVRGLAALPFRWQRPIAERLFGRHYPYPIMRQYLRAHDVLDPFIGAGLRGYPVLTGRMGKKLRGTSALYGVASEFFWNVIIVEHPGATAGRSAGL